MLKAMAICGALSSTMLIASHAFANAPKRVDIPAGDLSQALLRLSQQYDADLVYRPEQVHGLKTRGAHGELTSEQAITRLLEGTGLQVRAESSGALVITASEADPPIRVKAPTDPAPEPARAQIESIVVTGTMLKRQTSEAALPVATLDARALTRAGAADAEQLVQLVAQNQSTTRSNTSVGAGTGFASYASLRSLGSARTLVLLNGKRLANNPYQSLGVDLNTVPLAFIDHVDAVTDGASAAYVTDAPAGVINFVTRREVHGLTVSATTMQPAQSGGGQTFLGYVGGGIGLLKEDGWNLSVDLSWRKSTELSSTSRDFARTSFIPERGYNRLNATTFPANYTQTGSGVAGNPSAPVCQPPLSLPAGNGNCGFDSAPDTPLLPQFEQWSGLLKGTLALGSDLASVEYVRSHSDLISNIAPPTAIGLTMESNNPFFPGRGITPGAVGLNQALPVSVSWRVTEAGRATSNPRSTTDRLVGTLEGTVLGWDYELSALKSSSIVTLSFLDGYVNTQKLREGLAGTNGAPFLNPFGPQTAAGLQYLLDNKVIGEMQRAKSDLTIAGVQITRKALTLPAGPLLLALAGEYKEESSQFRNNFALTRLPQNSGLDLAQDASGSRHSGSLAAETSIPMLKSLDASLSVRYDNYSGFGHTFNPKVLIRYQPFEPLTVHGSYNTGFRAPTLYDVFAPTSLLQARIRSNDPLLCPDGIPKLSAGAVTTRDCDAQFNLQGSGNTRLNAERSRAYSVGFLLQPTFPLSFGVDYWSYLIKRTISALAESAIYSDPNKYAGLYVRCSAVPAAQRVAIGICNIPGGDPIAYIVDTASNLGDIRTSGLDITSKWSSGMLRFGRFDLSYRGTYVTRYDFQREANGPIFSRDGVFLDGSPVLRYSHFVGFNWDRAAWAAQLSNRYKSGYEDCNAGCVIDPQFFRRVSSYSLWNLAVSYSGIEHLALSAGVTNLFDTNPPFTNRKAGIGNGYDERYADPLGRVYSLTASYQL